MKTTGEKIREGRANLGITPVSYTHLLPGEVQQLIRTMTSDFLTEFYNFLRERGVDVSTSKCVFAGGGSLLLRGIDVYKRQVWECP